jgi:hypothetical protein
MTLRSAPAPVENTFWPLMTQCSPSRRALVRIAPASEPAPGSVIEIDILMRPSSSRGSQCWRCASVPLCRMFRPLNTQVP